MSGLEVVVRPRHDNGGLNARYDEESGILSVESCVQRPWPFGVDIDGNLVFDLDAQRILANFDLHIPRDRWERDWTPIDPPAARSGDLEFTCSTVTQKSFHLPISVRMDPASRQVSIDFARGNVGEFVGLSESCFAIVSGSELRGFLLTI